MQHCITVNLMTEKATLELIQDDIRSIKSQIDILRMETRAHQLESLAYLLDLAYQEVQNSVMPGTEIDGSIFRPVVLQ